MKESLVFSTPSRISNILVVDDAPTDLQILTRILKGQGYRVSPTATGNSALERVKAALPDLVLLDIGLPDIGGHDVCVQLKANPKTADIPVIFISASDQVRDQVKAFSVGGADYIIKPFRVQEVLARVQHQLQIGQLQTQLKAQNQALHHAIQEHEATEADLRASEIALRASEAKYRDLVQTANSIILRWNTQGIITFLNDYGQRFFSYDESSILGRNVIGTIIPATESSGRDLRGLIQNVCEAPDQYLFHENENICRNGERVWIAWTNKPILNDQGQLVEILSVGTNITARKRADEALEAAKAAAEAANQTKSQFLANMSHELRTPMNAILGFTQLLTRNTDLSAEQRSHLDIIQNSGEHLLELINDVLDMSKIEAGHMTLNEGPCALFHLLNTLEDTFKLKATGKGLDLRVDHSPHLPQFIHTDEGKLRQILMNLLSNAIKFTQRGQVTLRVDMGAKNQAADQDELDTGLFDQTVPLAIAVADTGPGIPPNELDKIFEAFVQTETGRQSQIGTGLGLPISQAFVRLLGGELEVQSELNRGTVFQFSVRVREIEGDGVRSPLTRRVTGLAPQQQTYRILVADDRWESRHLMVKLLEPLGFEVREAENGQQAIQVWSDWAPHLIWMDMRMPVMDGYEATRHIKTHLKGQATVVIALTASALEQDKAVVLSAGCDDFVHKPFQEKEILAKLAEYLGVRYQYQEEVSANNNLDSGIAPADVQAQHLQHMPRAWIHQVQDAATLADAELLLQLVDQIPSDHTDLVKGLTGLINNFRCDRILHLAQLAQQSTADDRLGQSLLEGTE